MTSFDSILGLLLPVALMLSLATPVGPGETVATDGWRTSAPEQQGLSSRTLALMFRDIQAKGGAGLHSVLVVKNGVLVVEAYLPPYHRNTLHNSKSASKSILSALTGIALERGILKSLDQRVSDFYPDHATGPGKRDITLRHLLTMSAGFEWSAQREGGGKPYPYDLEAWKIVPMRNAPGQEYQYNTMLAHMMSAILTKATGGTKRFADEVLFGPLGISNVVWTKDDQGIDIGGSEMFLRPDDMAKFGQLYLQGGLWNGQQIVPRTWIAESTAPRWRIAPDPCTGKPTQYGYWWWISGGGYMAKGSIGQYIMVRPDRNTVVVVTGEHECAIYPYLEPYLFAPNPPRLPADVAAAAAFRGLLQQLEDPAPTPVGVLPQIARRISRRRFVLDANDMGMRSMALAFTGASEARMSIALGTVSLDFPIGLDGRPRVADVGVPLGNGSTASHVAAQGTWTAADTFAFRFHIVGDVISQHFVLRFTGDDVAMEMDSGIGPMQMTGRLEKPGR